MRMEEKKARVMAYLRGQHVEGYSGHLPLKEWHSPTEIGDAVIPHSALTAGSSVASPVCKALVRDGLLERDMRRGLYRLKLKGKTDASE